MDSIFLKIQGFLGILVFILIALLISENRSKFNIKSIFFFTLAQFLIVLIFIFIPYSNEIFIIINKVVMKIQAATEFGTSFVFGYLGGDTPPFETTDDGNLFILAFRAIPLIIVVSAISSLLFHLGILPYIVRIFSRMISFMSVVNPASAFAASANIFVGMVEAPLLVKPYLEKMSRSDLFILMTTGMCTVAGTVFALYVIVLNNLIPNIAGHLILSSIVSVFAGVMFSQIIIPSEGKSHDPSITIKSEKFLNMIDAITSGTTSGLKVSLNIIAMLVVALAMVYLINSFLSIFPDIDSEPITLQSVLGYFFAPIMWLTGMEWSESKIAGGLMGIKTILNEFVAFIELSKLDSKMLSVRAQIMTVYALSGFANLGSLGIMIAGLASIVPTRREEILELAPKSLISGTLATLLTASIIGIVI